MSTLGNALIQTLDEDQLAQLTALIALTGLSEALPYDVYRELADAMENADVAELVVGADVHVRGEWRLLEAGQVHFFANPKELEEYADE